MEHFSSFWDETRHPGRRPAGGTGQGKISPSRPCAGPNGTEGSICTLSPSIVASGRLLWPIRSAKPMALGGNLDGPVWPFGECEKWRNANFCSAPFFLTCIVVLCFLFSFVVCFCFVFFFFLVPASVDLHPTSSKPCCWVSCSTRRRLPGACPFGPLHRRDFVRARWIGSRTEACGCGSRWSPSPQRLWGGGVSCHTHSHTHNTLFISP